MLAVRLGEKCPWGSGGCLSTLFTQHKFWWLSRERIIFGSWEVAVGRGCGVGAAISLGPCRPSPTRQVVPGVSGKADGEGQSVSERSPATLGLGLLGIALAIRAFHIANCGHLGFSTASLISGPSMEDIQRHNEVISHFKAENAG